MKVYISGMITSLKHDQYRKAFKNAVTYIESKGHEAVDPSVAGTPEQHSWNYYMRKAIPQLCECDAIYMLEGYGNSRGALIEKNLAEQLDMVVMYESIEKLNDETELLND